MPRRFLLLAALCLQINGLIGCAPQPVTSLPPTPSPLIVIVTSTFLPSATPFEPPVDPATLTLIGPVIVVGTAEVGPALTSIPPVQSTQVTSTPPAPGETLTLTLADNGRSITLSVGQEFLLFLDQSGMLWTVTIDDQNIVSPVMGVMPINGSQGLFRANQIGQTTLSAVGDPPCRQSLPPCMMPSLLFQIQIIVQ